MDHIDLSVIVPVYNLEQWITPLIESLKVQELDGYTMEVIFVLNNCTDRSEDVIRGSGIDCTIMNCEQQGAGAARNAGFDIASGDYVWFIDGDDWLMSSKAVHDAVDLAKRHGVNILRIPFQSDGFGGMWYGMVWQYVFKREFIADLRFPEWEAWRPGEDNVFVDLVFAKAGYSRIRATRMRHTEDAQYFYNYPREGSIMHAFHAGKNK